MFPAYFYTLLIVIAIFGHYSHGSSITLLNTPSLLCVQDTVQFSCTVTSPGFIYESTNAGLNINSSINCVSAGQIGAGTAPRLSVMSTGGTLSAPSAQYTISPFLLQDNMTQYRCCANNASNFVQDFTDFISLPLAAPPSTPTILNIFSTFDSDSTCTGTINLTLSAVASDRAVISYEVLLNETVNGTTGNTTYTTGSLNLLEHYANYTVVATSCAGSSMASSPVMFTALTPTLPSAPTSVSMSSVYDSDLTCTGTITLTWPIVIADRNVTSYEVLLGGAINVTIGTTAFTTGTLNLIEHSATYTVRAINCVGSGMPSSAVMFTALTPAAPSQPTITSISSAFDSDLTCTGTITLAWAQVISDRNVTSYQVLQNGTMNGTIGTTAFTTGTLNLVEHSATYSVRAINCAGSGAVSTLSMFAALTPASPSSASISMSTAYDSDKSCYGTITLTWPIVIADRNVTSYEVLLGGTINATTGTTTFTTSNMSLATFNGRYTVRAVSCAGSSVSNEVVFTPPTTPSTPITATSPSITSLQPSSCTARIAYTLQQPADSRNVTSYLISNSSSVIQTLSAYPNNMYSFYYDIILNTTASLYITAENCVGNSSPRLITLPTVQGVSAVNVSVPVINANISIYFNLLFIDTSAYPVEVNFTVYAIATFTNGTTDNRSIDTGVKNSGTMYSLTIPIPHLSSGTPLGLNSDVKNLSIMVSVNSQCGQALTLSSNIAPINTDETPTTTIASTATTATVATTASTTPQSNITISTAEGQACGSLGCPAVIGIAIVLIVIVIIIVIAILAIILCIIICRRRSNNNVKFSHDSGLFDKDTPRQSVRNEMEMTPSYNDDDMPTYAQVTKSIKKPPAVKPKPTELIYAEMDFSKDLPKLITESPEKPVIAETIYSMVTALDDSTDPQLYPNLDTAYQGAQYTPSSLYSNVS